MNKPSLSQEILTDLEGTDLNIFDMLRKHKFVVRQKAFTL